MHWNNGEKTKNYKVYRATNKQHIGGENAGATNTNQQLTGGGGIDCVAW